MLAVSLGGRPLRDPPSAAERLAACACPDDARVFFAGEVAGKSKTPSPLLDRGVAAVRLVGFVGFLS